MSIIGALGRICLRDFWFHQASDVFLHQQRQRARSVHFGSVEFVIASTWELPFVLPMPSPSLPLWKPGLHCRCPRQPSALWLISTSTPSHVVLMCTFGHPAPKQLCCAFYPRGSTILHTATLSPTSSPNSLTRPTTLGGKFLNPSSDLPFRNVACTRAGARAVDADLLNLILYLLEWWRDFLVLSRAPKSRC